MIGKVLTMRPHVRGRSTRRRGRHVARSAGVTLHMVGHAPMQDLTLWRMQMAARILADSSMKASAVGNQVEYESEAAFSRAFKKTVGLSPTAWHQTTTGSN